MLAWCRPQLHGVEPAPAHGLESMSTQLVRDTGVWQVLYIVKTNSLKAETAPEEVTRCLVEMTEQVGMNLQVCLCETRANGAGRVRLSRKTKVTFWAGPTVDDCHPLLWRYKALHPSARGAACHIEVCSPSRRVCVRA